MFGMGQPHGDHVVRPVSDEMFRELPRRRDCTALTDTTRVWNRMAGGRNPNVGFHRLGTSLEPRRCALVRKGRYQCGLPLPPQDQTGWLLAIGARLRVEYDVASAAPLPAALVALVKQLENSAKTSDHRNRMGLRGAVWANAGGVPQPPTPHPSGDRPWPQKAPGSSLERTRAYRNFQVDMISASQGSSSL